MGALIILNKKEWGGPEILGKQQRNNFHEIAMHSCFPCTAKSGLFQLVHLHFLGHYD